MNDEYFDYEALEKDSRAYVYFTLGIVGFYLIALVSILLLWIYK